MFPRLSCTVIYVHLRFRVMLRNSPFKMPKIGLYIGKHKFYTPYFEPMGFHRSLISFRRLKLKSAEQRKEFEERYPHLKDNNQAKFSNLPMVRRNNSKILFNRFYFSWGVPIKFVKVGLGWKTKWDSPRFEWSPSWQFWFFKWQIVFYYEIENPDKFWEMYLWWRYFSDCDIKKAEETWSWVDLNTGLSTWDKNLLKNE